MSVWCIQLAGGRGARFGADVPKQFLPLAGEEHLLIWSVRAAAGVADGQVLVVPPAYAALRPDGVDAVVVGGAERADSVRAGLAAVPEDAEVVIVHDTARPLASRALFAAVVAAVRNGADGVVPGIAVVDTVKRVADGVVVETLVRDELVAVQTPQAFTAAALRAAHAGGADATDDAGLVEAAGGRVVVVPGEPHNEKITHVEDLAVAARRLAEVTAR